MSDKLKIMQEKIEIQRLTTSSRTGLYRIKRIRRYIPHQLSSWHLQLAGSVNSALNRDVFDIDLYDSSMADIASLQQRGVYVPSPI